MPIIPDEARTFGMDALFKELGIYASNGQLYEPVDHNLLLSYMEAKDGQILEEGITEAGSLASWIAAGTSYATRGVPMVPFFTFYSMFGFQRVGDLIWQAADARARGFLLGATAGRTTLLGEGLQHQDGHSLLLASTVPVCEAYDPAFAYETGAIINRGIERMYGADAGEDVFYYLTLYNETYVMPARPEGRHRRRHQPRPVPLGRRARRRPRPPGDDPVLRVGAGRGACRRRGAAPSPTASAVDLWSVTSYKRLREEALAVRALEPAAPRRRAAHAARDRGARRRRRARSSPSPTSCVRCPTRSAGGCPRPYTSLGTDGFGRTDTREALRRFFEIDAAHVVVAVLAGAGRRRVTVDPAVGAQGRRRPRHRPRRRAQLGAVAQGGGTATASDRRRLPTTTSASASNVSPSAAKRSGPSWERIRNSVTVRSS